MAQVPDRFAPYDPRSFQTERMGFTVTAAFSNIRVIDFSRVIAGPIASQQLALLGADVVKIEEPGMGDQLRQLATTAELATANTSPMFLSANVNKRSLTLDLKSEAGRNVIRRLLETADVVIENFRAGAMDRLGLGYDFARSVKPDIIYCSVSGYGQEGPEAGTRAYDPAIQAISGMMSVTGTSESGPMRGGYAPVDVPTGQMAAFAIASALFRRAQTGKGQFLDVAMLDTALTLQVPGIMAYALEESTYGLNGNASQTGEPAANVFATADGHVQIAAFAGNQSLALFDLVGVGDHFPMDKLADAHYRIENRAEISPLIEAEMKKRTTAEWLQVLEQAAVPCAPIQTYEQMLEMEQLKHRSVVREINLPGPLSGRHKTLTSGFVADEDGPEVTRISPMLGEHSEEVLREAGFSDQEIQSLQADGVV